MQVLAARVDSHGLIVASRLDLSAIPFSSSFTMNRFALRTYPRVQGLQEDEEFGD
jgi:hypothetical protein